MHPLKLGPFGEAPTAKACALQLLLSIDFGIFRICEEPVDSASELSSEAKLRSCEAAKLDFLSLYFQKKLNRVINYMNTFNFKLPSLSANGQSGKLNEMSI